MQQIITPEKIDALLPQTQCELCGYKGCMPYAKALSEQKAAINLCPPGGITGLLALAELLDQDPTPFIEEMAQKTKPKMKAVIREPECIGCTKCIKVCPVDAILGAGKQMHVVITDQCTGCELCIAPCPVDCIDMIELPHETITEQEKQFARDRFQKRAERLVIEKNSVKKIPQKTASTPHDYLQAAVARAKEKKLLS